jgi:pre-mRNA-processing factor 19
MTWICAISGEPLEGSHDTVVVTPSGHVCRQSLLSQALAESGGRNPFDPTQALALDDCIVVRTASLAGVVPPRSKSSVSTVLHHLHEDYQALILELFDTRQALEATRQELSQALYQNDAAVRVVARLARERDQARALLAEAPEMHSEPVHKKARVETSVTTTDTTATDNGATNTAIPDTDIQLMWETWQTLHPTRKSMLHQAAANALLVPQLSQLSLQTSHAWHSAGIAALSVYGTAWLATASTNSELVVYNWHAQTIRCTISAPHAITCLAVNETYVCAGDASGSMHVWNVDAAETSVALVPMSHDVPIVSLHLHPDQVHVIAACQNGTLAVARVHDTVWSRVGGVQQQSTDTATNTNTTTTCGALHPDGLIYVTGTSSGNVHVWDLRGQTVASTLSSLVADAVGAVTVSPNCYHVAVAHASGTVVVWDVRKQSVVATIPSNEKVHAITFDPSGKYLAMGGVGGVRVVVVKQWTTVAVHLELACAVTALHWGDPLTLVVASNEQRDVLFYSLPKQEEEGA